MSLVVEVYVGSHLDKNRRKLVAEAVLHNISDLADISDYQGTIIEYEAPHLDIQFSKKDLTICEHPRKSSVWSLIKKMVKSYD